MNTCYLYRHIRLDKNEPFYIGIGGTTSFDDYNRAHEKCDRNNIWKKIVNKTEYEVEILFDNISFDEVNEKEKEFIKLYGRININTGILANMTDGGEGGNGVVYERTKEHRDKIRNILKGRKRPKEVVDKFISTRIKNEYKHSNEVKLKISRATSGKNNPFYGKTHSEESKQKIRQNNNQKGENNGFYGKKHGPKMLERICTKVLDLETGIFYDSILELSSSIGIGYSNLRSILNKNKNSRFLKLKNE